MPCMSLSKVGYCRWTLWMQPLTGLTITDLDNLQSSVISYEESPIIAYPHQ